MTASVKPAEDKSEHLAFAMNRIEYLAAISVHRACGFGALAIVTAMVGVIPMPVVAAKLGATLTALMAVILLFKAVNAPNQPYRTTELWIMLDKNHGLPETHAQRILMRALQECYARAAKVAFSVGFALWVVGFFLGFAGY
jgi:hypothetical protein